jgi:hypothetical protein
MSGIPHFISSFQGSAIVVFQLLAHCVMCGGFQVEAVSPTKQGQAGCAVKQQSAADVRRRYR